MYESVFGMPYTWAVWAGALAGIVTGGIPVICWSNLSGGLFDLYEIVPGVMLSAAAIVGASLLTAPPARLEGGP